ncbi:hypothetical protein ABZ554_36705 [Streptomyces sp. NPDC020125]|uniref:hypothetical protein n=1 Tax=Streptomyces sp. NPDC020125 TaxID=3154593 RepID=UPI0033C7EDD2
MLEQPGAGEGSGHRLEVFRGAPLCGQGHAFQFQAIARATAAVDRSLRLFLLDGRFADRIAAEYGIQAALKPRPIRLP